MQYFPVGRDFVLRLDPGDEIVESIDSFLNEVDLPLASVSGIGAVDKVRVGRYLLASKQYESVEMEGAFEIVALTGNVTRKDGKPYVHVHLAFSDDDMVLRGGHLNFARVSVTAEIFFRRYDGEIGRVVNAATGINFLD